MSAVDSIGTHPRQARRKRERPDHVPKHLQDVLDLDDFERAARPKLPHAVYGYVAHGAETETTLRGNRAAFDAWRLLTRVLVGVSERHQDIQLFGRRYAAPFGIAPMGAAPWSRSKAILSWRRPPRKRAFRSFSAPIRSFHWKRWFGLIRTCGSPPINRRIAGRSRAWSSASFALVLRSWWLPRTCRSDQIAKPTRGQDSVFRSGRA